MFEYYHSPYIDNSELERKLAKERFEYKLHKMSDINAKVEMDAFHRFADDYLDKHSCLYIFNSDGSLKRDSSIWPAIKSLKDKPGLGDELYIYLYELYFAIGLGQYSKRKHFDKETLWKPEEYVFSYREPNGKFEGVLYDGPSLDVGAITKAAYNVIRDGNYLIVQDSFFDNAIEKMIAKNDAYSREMTAENKASRCMIVLNGMGSEAIIADKQIPGLKRNSKGLLSTGYEYGTDFEYNGAKIELKNYKTDDDIHTQALIDKMMSDKKTNHSHKADYILCIIRNMRIGDDMLSKYNLLKKADNTYKRIPPNAGESDDIDALINQLPPSQDFIDLAVNYQEDKKQYLIYSI